MSKIKVKNWETFQHFKNRRPPWIKLYRTILDQRDINMISDCSFRILIGLWLLASEDKEQKGYLPPIDDIAFRLRMEKRKIIKSLHELKSFLIFDDINMISSRYQDDAPETETETETETKNNLIISRNGFNEFWKSYPKKVGKIAAQKAWKKLKHPKTLLPKILIAIENQKQSDQWKKDNGQYIPNPATWLNRGSWEDELYENKQTGFKEWKPKPVK